MTDEGIVFYKYLLIVILYKINRMNKVGLTALLLLKYLVTVAQVDIGTIELNQNYTATLNFSGNIEFVVIGNNPQTGISADSTPIYRYYGIFKSGKTVVLRGKDPSAPKTSITVKLENGLIYYGLLLYGDNTRIFYDFSAPKNNIQKDSTSTKEKEKQQITNNLKKVLALENEYVEGIEENLLEVVVSNIRNDDRYTYFRISIKNESGNDYVIDNTTFKYVEGKNKGLFKKGSKIEEREMIVYQTDNNTVKAYSTADFGFVIPLFAVGTKSGILKIQFIEKKGTRNPSLELKSRTMLKVKTL